MIKLIRPMDSGQTLHYQHKWKRTVCFHHTSRVSHHLTVFTAFSLFKDSRLVRQHQISVAERFCFKKSLPKQTQVIPDRTRTEQSLLAQRAINLSCSRSQCCLSAKIWNAVLRRSQYTLPHSLVGRKQISKDSVDAKSSS